jgi:hypothetical protein
MVSTDCISLLCHHEATKLWIESLEALNLCDVFKIEFLIVIYMQKTETRSMPVTLYKYQLKAD